MSSLLEIRCDRLLRATLLTVTLLIAMASIFSKRGLLDWLSLRQQHSAVLEKQAHVERETTELKASIDRLSSHPREQELVVRKTLGYVRSDELVIEFPE